MIEKIFFACDAGMGSSVMGVSLMKNKVEEAGLPVEVEHISVKNITEEPDLIVTTNALKARVEDTIAKYEKESPHHDSRKRSVACILSDRGFLSNRDLCYWN